MTGAAAADGPLRGSIIALLASAGAADLTLLAEVGQGEAGDPECWAAVPVVAHNTEFKRQQVERLLAVRQGRRPADYPEVDHRSAELYKRYAVQPAGQVAAESGAATGALIDALYSVSAADLADPARNPWLAGRMLWLQIAVRGFWHPTGHLIGYYLSRGQAGRAVALAAHGVATASYAGVPDQARGMADYNLACAQARAGRTAEASAALRDAIARNPDLRSNARRDPDLAEVAGAGPNPGE